MNYRIEYDSIGSCQVPAAAYYGVNTVRAAENFNITGRPVHAALIEALVEIKQAAAMANQQAGQLAADQAQAIIQACVDILAGACRQDIIVDAIQGGAGTSTNMNVNEVIANRALEILGQAKGDYALINPNDHVNMGQSTNDVYPSAGRMAILRLLQPLLAVLEELSEAVGEKARQFDDVVKIGRTQLADAVPIRLGQEFAAWRAVIDREKERLQRLLPEVAVLNLGGTAIGTGINAHPDYIRTVVPILNQITGLELRQADNLIDATQNLDALLAVSATLRGCAVSLSKIANDLRLMSSGPKAGLGEITLPARQNGSSIMPGKINPVIPEVINQIAFNIIGQDMTAALAVQSGQLELNAFEPVLFDNLLNGIYALTQGIRSLTENCIKGIKANPEQCRNLLEKSTGLATALCPLLGYQRSAEIAKQALRENLKMTDLIRREKILTAKQMSVLLDARKMTSNRHATAVHD